MFACIHAPEAAQTALLDLASSFSPLVEDTAPGTVIFSIVGLGRLIGGAQEIAAAIAREGAARLGGASKSAPDRLGVQSHLAISADPDTAVLAARNLRGITLIPPGREADRLGGLPVNALGSFLQAEGDPGTILEILGTLERWGIHTLGELAELPEIGFVARFGEIGTRILRLARGETRRALHAMQPPENYERSVDLEHPEALLEPLLFVISSQLTELLEALERNGLATNRVTLGLKLVKNRQHARTLEFPVPVRDPKVILKQLQFDLESHPPQAAIVGIHVRLNPVEPRTLQHGLFLPKAPAPEKLQLTLARLTALVGEGNVGSPKLLDTHRPDAFVMQAFSPEKLAQGGKDLQLPSGTMNRAPLVRFAFRYYRPPAAAQVRLKQERPAFVDAQSASGEVLAAAGPWRSSGDWWVDSWARDEWDIELSNGGLYRVYRSSREWFLEGMYD